MTGLPTAAHVGGPGLHELCASCAVLTLNWGQTTKCRVTPVCTDPFLRLMAKSRFSPLGSVALWTLLFCNCSAKETEDGSFEKVENMIEVRKSCCNQTKNPWQCFFSGKMGAFVICRTQCSGGSSGLEKEKKKIF